METKHELHPDLQDASLEKACEMANSLVWDIAAGYPRGTRNNPEKGAADLHYMLEYLRLNFDLVPKVK